MRILRNCEEILSDPRKDAYSRLAQASECLLTLNRWDFPEHLRNVFDEFSFALGFTPASGLVNGFECQVRVRQLSLGQVQQTISKIQRLRETLDSWLLRQSVFADNDKLNRPYLY